MPGIQGDIVSQVFGGTVNQIGAGVPSPLLYDEMSQNYRPGKSSHRVYNFEVAEHHTYIADGVRVHNTSVLSFLNPQQLVNIVPGSLEDQDGNGSFDYVEIDNKLSGLAASGSTIYKLETVDGQFIAKAYVTHADEQGRLVQSQFLQDENGQIVEGSLRQIVLTGAEFGEQAGRLVTPFITAALLGDDASVFERFAADTIIGTFVQNAFEFVGGAIHDQIVSGGLQNNTLDDIASITFADFGDDLIENAVDNVEALLSQWIMAEVFEGLNTDTFGGKLAQLLIHEGVDYILDLTVHQLATDVFGLDAHEIQSWGLTAPQFNQVFSGPNLLNLVFKAAIGTILPDLESTEAQIGSGLITLALDVFAGIGGIWGSVIGYIGGLILDLFFDEDPQAFTNVTYSSFTESLIIGQTYTDDGGTKAIATGAAGAYVDFVNGLLESAHSSSNNLSELAETMNLVFGHYEEHFRNGDGQNYATIQQAIMARIVDTIQGLQLNDGDVKFATAIAYIANNSSTGTAEEILNEFSMRVQVAADYQSYLEQKEFYDALIAADPESTFSAGWVTTFLLAREYGYAEDFIVTGDDVSSIHITSSGNDLVEAGGGDDVIRTFAGDDILRGGQGDDILYGGSGNDQLGGNQGDDILYGGAGDNKLWGGAGINQYYLGHGNNIVYGGENEDLATFAGNYSDYTVEDLGDNHVVVTHTETGAVNDLNAVEFLRFKDTVRTFDPSYNNFVVGTAGDDLLNGTDLRDAINGLAGDDIIYGFDGDDFLSGDAGDDQIFGGAGNDWIFGSLGNDWIESGPGDDHSDGGEHDDYIWGDSGDDTLLGQGGDDVLNGGDGVDDIDGGGGDDLLEGGAGEDIITGGVGDDNLYGGDGRDTLSGGWGDDEIHGGALGDSIDAGHGDDVIYADGGWDTIFASDGDDVVHGGGGNDTIFGGWGDDLVYGGDGDDKIFSLLKAYAATPFTYNGNVNHETGAADHYNEWGRDVAYGGAGNDQIALNGIGSVAFGGSGDDMIYLGLSQQRADGGAGTDTVRLQSNNFKDAVWYRSEEGRVGAIIFDTKSGMPAPAGLRALSTGDHEYYLVVDVEYISMKNGNTLEQGYSFNRGYGNGKYQNPSYSGYVDITNDEFEDFFSEDSFLNRRFLTVHRTYSGEEAGVETTPYNPDWDVFGDGDDVITEADGGNKYRFSGDQRIRGGGGNDEIEGRSGNDHLQGEAGNDTLRGGTGSDILDGGDGWDTLDGGSGADTIYGGGGWDTISAGTGDDEVHGGWGEDLIYGGAGDDTLHGDQHNDEIHGNSGRDLIYGGEGHDKLYGGNAPDVIKGGDGNDTIYGEDGGDDLDGGGHEDIIYGGLGVDRILGGSGNDVLYGEDGSDELDGQAGNDTLYGGNAADNLFGGSGNDALFGNAGNDDLRGNDGNDTLVGGHGADLLDGGAGIDTANYTSAGASVSVDLSTGSGASGDAEGDSYVSIENVIGSDSADQLTGDDFANTLEGGLGGDLLNGRGGADTLAGGAGHDDLSGGAGADVLMGEAGDDSLDGGTGEDTLTGGEGDDRLSGGDGNDNLSGGNHSDYLSGGYGDDILNGDDGHDILSGDEGADALFGGAGNDILAGGGGADVLTGGSGSDGFVMSYGQGHDTIEDFTIGTDKIGLPAGISQVFILDEADGARVLIGLNASFLLKGVSAALLSVTDFSAPAGSSFEIIDGLFGADEATSGVGIVDGTAGIDTINTAYADDPDGDVVHDDALIDDVVYGNGGDDKIYLGRGDDTAHGGAGDDRIYGQNGANTIYGDDGNDFLNTGSRSSVLDGGAGDDTLQAVLSKGGDHTLTGGAGADTFEFVYNSATKSSDAHITDFEVGVDTLLIGGLDFATQDPAALSGDYSLSAAGDGSLVISFDSNSDTITIDGVTENEFWVI